MKYSEFVDSLTGTDPVKDAQLVRSFTQLVGMAYLDIGETFSGLLIWATQGSVHSRLHRESAEYPFVASVTTFADREACARMIGVWVLHRHNVEMSEKGTNYWLLDDKQKDYVAAFAMELLLPAGMFEVEVRNRRIVDVKSKFGVTTDMMYRRMKELDLL